MKRFAVFTVMLIASMLLTSCQGLSQATVSPGATATQAGTDMGETGQPETSTPVSTSVTGENQAQAGQVGTVVGTMAPLLPDTGEFDMEGTPEPVGTAALSSNGLVFPNAGTPFEGIGTSMAGTPSAPHADLNMDDLGSGVPNTGAQESLLRLSQLMTLSFGDNGGGIVGKVTDFVIDVAQARVSYVVVTANNRQVLVPWSAVTVAGTNGFGFTGTAEQLKAAPAFEPGSIDFNTQSWQQSFQQFWGGSGTVTATQVASGQGAGQPAILASQLMQITVTVPGMNLGTAVPNTGSGLGRVQDALVNQKSGDVAWLLVSVNNNFINLNNRLIPVPFSELGTNLDVKGLLLTLNQNLLSNAPNLDATNLPDLFGSDWQQEFFEFWNNSGFGPQPVPSGTVQP